MVILEHARRAVALITTTLVITACTSIQLVSTYDEVIDNQAQDLQKKIDKHFTSLQLGDEESLKYKSNLNFYKETLTDLNAMAVRASAIYKNKLTIQQIELAKINLAYVVLLNKKCIYSTLSPEQIAKVNTNGIDLSMDCNTEKGATKDEPARGEQKLNRATISPIKNLFNQHLGAIMALELAKKRGDSDEDKK